MARKVSRRTDKDRCPLTGDTSLRAAANKTTAAIQDAFPAGVSQPALRALAGAGYRKLDQLAKVTEADLKKLHGMGPKAIDNLRAALKARGKSFRK